MGGDGQSLARGEPMTMTAGHGCQAGVRRETARGGGTAESTGRTCDGSRPGPGQPPAAARLTRPCPELRGHAGPRRGPPPSQAGSQGSRPRPEVNESPPPHARLLQATAGLVPMSPGLVLTSSFCSRTPRGTPPGASAAPRRPRLGQRLCLPRFSGSGSASRVLQGSRLCWVFAHGQTGQTGPRGCRLAA